MIFVYCFDASLQSPFSLAMSELLGKPIASKRIIYYQSIPTI